MIQKIEVTGVHLEVDEKINKYVTKKLGKLDKYLPKKVKDSAHLEVILKDNKNNVNHSMCEVILFLPNSKLVVMENTINIFAAIDIVEEKLKVQIKKYKELHEVSRRNAKLLKNKIKKI